MFNRFVSISNGYECCKVIIFNSIQKVDSTRRQKQTTTKQPRNNQKRKKKSRVQTKQNESGIVSAIGIEIEFGLLKLMRWRRTTKVLIYNVQPIHTIVGAWFAERDNAELQE